MRNKGQLAYPSNFEVKKTAPLDARTVCDSYEHLMSADWWNFSDGVWLYKGLNVSVTEDNSIYQCVDPSKYTTSEGWKKVTSEEQMPIVNVPPSGKLTIDNTEDSVYASTSGDVTTIKRSGIYRVHFMGYMHTLDPNMTPIIEIQQGAVAVVDGDFAELFANPEFITIDETDDLYLHYVRGGGEYKSDCFRFSSGKWHNADVSINADISLNDLGNGEYSLIFNDKEVGKISLPAADYLKNISLDGNNLVFEYTSGNKAVDVSSLTEDLDRRLTTVEGDLATLKKQNSITGSEYIDVKDGVVSLKTDDAASYILDNVWDEFNS